ncbi:MAG: redoxin domain-containing protein [Pontiellaceae bacterium]|nr:redoxin domain-containing protein [Pontiellaceae bacterium]
MINQKKWSGYWGAALMLTTLFSCDKGVSVQPRNLEIKVASNAAIRERIEESKSPLTLIHVWATWCPPCVAEFPELLKVYDETKDAGLKLQLISADEPSETTVVRKFLDEQGSPVGSLIAEELSEEFIELLSPNWSGALPASFFFDSSGTLVAEWEGAHTHEEYMETISSLLKIKKGATP